MLREIESYPCIATFGKSGAG